MMNFKNFFTNRFSKVYIWQFISLIVRMLSLLIVIPIISFDKSVYGIYSLILSIQIFLNYGDFGIFSSVKRFLIEFNDNNHRDFSHLQKFSFFSGFVLWIFFSFLLSIIYFNPDFLIKDINYEEIDLIKDLILICSVNGFALVFQKIVAIYYQINIMDDILKKIQICGNVLIILFAFFLDSYDVFNLKMWYLFSSFVQIIVFFIIYINALKRKLIINHYFFTFFNFFNSDLIKNVFNFSIPLFVSSICWLLFYEFDNFIIGKTLGINQVAIYSASVVFLIVTRSVFGIIFNPINVNAIYAFKKSVKTGGNYISNSFLFLFLIGIFFCSSLFLFSEDLINYVYGNNYYESVQIVNILLFQFLFYPFFYLAGTVLENFFSSKKIIVISIFTVTIYYSLIFFNLDSLSLLKLAIFKIVTFFLISILYFIVLINYLNFTKVVSNIFYFFILIFILTFFIQNLIFSLKFILLLLITLIYVIFKRRFFNSIFNNIFKLNFKI